MALQLLLREPSCTKLMVHLTNQWFHFLLEVSLFKQLFCMELLSLTNSQLKQVWISVFHKPYGPWLLSSLLLSITASTVISYNYTITLEWDWLSFAQFLLVYHQSLQETRHKTKISLSRRECQPTYQSWLLSSCLLHQPQSFCFQSTFAQSVECPVMIGLSDTSLYSCSSFKSWASSSSKVMKSLSAHASTGSALSVVVLTLLAVSSQTHLSALEDQVAPFLPWLTLKWSLLPWCKSW